MPPPLFPLEPGGPLRPVPPGPPPRRDLFPRELNPGVGPLAVDEARRQLRDLGLLDALNGAAKFGANFAEDKAVKVALYTFLTLTVRTVREATIKKPYLLPLNVLLGYAVTQLPFGTLGQRDEFPLPIGDDGLDGFDPDNPAGAALLDKLKLWIADP